MLPQTVYRVALIVGLVPSVAWAHDFWLEREARGFVLQYGHHGGQVLVLDGNKVKTVRCLRPGVAARDVRADAQVEGKALVVTVGCDVIAAFSDGGFWSLTPDGEKNLPKNKCPDAVKSWQSRQFAKWLDPRSPLASTPVGDEFEIVPVSDLAKTKSGDKASFRVLLGGKPVSGAVVAIDHKPLGETDSSGEVRIRIRGTELESLSVSLRRPLSSPEADAQIFEASLTFPVAK
jgi:uncharacterized GH25 family protein